MRDSIMDYSCRTNDSFPRDNLEMKCLICGDSSNGFLYHCRDCNDNLCQSCVNAHHLVRETKDHIIWRIDNPSSSMSSSTSSSLSFNSTEALDEIGIAQSHSQSISQAADAMWKPNEENRRNFFSELTRAFFYEIDPEGLSFQQHLDSAGEIMDSTYSKWKAAEIDIRALMHMYRLRVDEREKELLNELTASIAVKTTSLKREVNTYKAIQSSYERSMLILEDVLQNGQPFDILRAKEICNSEIQNARDLQECAWFPEEEVVFIPPDEEVLSGIQQMGRIISGGSKISSTPLHKNAADPTSLRTHSRISTSAEWKLASNVQSHVPSGSRNGNTPIPAKPKVGSWKPSWKFPSNVQSHAPSESRNGNTSIPAKPKCNAWSRPLKFSDPKPVRAIIPSLMSNPKVARVNSSSCKFDYKAAGQPKMIIGKDGSNDGELSRPWGVCCTNEGNIIVADRSNHRIQIFSPDGKFMKKFGKYGKEGQGCFDRPAGVAVDPRGRIFITDKDNHRIQVFTQDGEFVFMFGKEGKQCGQFHYPWDIAVNSVGHVAVTDTRNQRIQMFSNNGLFLRKFGLENVFYQTSNLDSPRGVCFNTEGNLVVTDFNNHRLLVIDSNFKKAKFLGGPGSGPKQFMRPQGVAVDNKGKIAIADSRNHRIQIIKEDGTYVWQFGCGGSDPGQLDRPCGVCFTPDGKTVVVDFGNNRVQIF